MLKVIHQFCVDGVVSVVVNNEKVRDLWARPAQRGGGTVHQGEVVFFCTMTMAGRMMTMPKSVCRAGRL